MIEYAYCGDNEFCNGSINECKMCTFPCKSCFGALTNNCNTCED